MKVELQAKVHSVVRCHIDQNNNIDRLRALLYPHTVVTDMVGYQISFAFSERGQTIPIILMTTSQADVELDARQGEASVIVVDRAFYRARYQLGRLESRSFYGTVCGSYSEAYQAAVEITIAHTP